ncbi:MAG: hypothetical protein AB7P03_19790 [Kofleriaceae bacterium]
MAKNESTAVNELIELMSSRPAPTLPGQAPANPPRHGNPARNPARMTSPLPVVREVAPLPRTRSPRGTSENPALPPIPPIRVTTAPVSRSTTIPPLAPPPVPPPRPSQERLATTPRRTLPMPAPTPPAPPMPRRHAQPLPPPSRPVSEIVAREIPAKVDLSNQTWFRDTGEVDAFSSAFTLGVPRRSGPIRLATKLLIPIGMLILAGVLIGGYLALDRRPMARAAPPAAVATAATPVTPPAPALPVAAAPAAFPSSPTAMPAPVAPAASSATPAAPRTTADTAAAPATARPTFIDVRIDSKPAGATVMLVDRGKTTLLGTTPLTAGIDPSRGYDLVFTYPHRPTHVQHLTANAGTRVEAVLERQVPALAHARVRRANDSRHAARSGKGVLMIASKPPCDIVVDGAPTGLVTPQRSLKLAPGTHTITLVNASQNIKKTISVSITAGKSTKVIQDLM